MVCVYVRPGGARRARRAAGAHVGAGAQDLVAVGAPHAAAERRRGAGAHGRQRPHRAPARRARRDKQLARLKNNMDEKIK
ncbi:unnamed protein product [Leptidea sinapis]|uniref:Uncharacterized protein n=1 Tax=Leptidea sinapis TaxID=189913 RepID=A0A5E4PUL5_9NEOP|nr:unnamed protein product [Leptidea sinapis]